MAAAVMLVSGCATSIGGTPADGGDPYDCYEAEYDGMIRCPGAKRGSDLADRPSKQIRVDEQFLSQALAGMRERAEAGEAEAQYVYGTMFGDDGAAKAATWFRRAAAQGHAKAQTRLGFMYQVGSGVEKDPRLAVEWLARAAENKFALAQYALGRMYLHGEGIGSDPRVAEKWLHAAAEQGHAIAQYELGKLYGAKDRAVAERWFRASATKGYAEAQYELARLYDYLDPGERRRLYESLGMKRTEAPPSMEIVEKPKRDRAEAIRWYAAAAEGGSLAAQQAMGKYAQDKVERLKWRYLVSEAYRDSPVDYVGVAQHARELETELTPKQRAEAARRAQEWSSKKPARQLVFRQLMGEV